MSERSCVESFVGLGSNLGDRAGAIERAVRCVDELDRVSVERRSGLYETEPRLVEEQPVFVNACVGVRTDLEANSLLERLLEVERRLGRVRGRERGPRAIDLDLLVHGRCVVDSSPLTVPHPGLAERAFVLVPLAEIAGDLRPPGFEATVRELLDRCDDEGWVRRLDGRS